jgi:hypothetical protein|tara:strand:+ start:3708 stop:3887 length:180 start_codon:yes stop_codon:yes gene_type:complete
MKVGDLVFDTSIGQRGLIVESKEWEGSGYPAEYEHTILYEDGDIDTAYEKELEVINEIR